MVTKPLKDVPYRSIRNPMAIYKENLTVKRKKKKAQSALYLECSFLPVKNRLPVADAAFKFCQMATGVLLL